MNHPRRSDISMPGRLAVSNPKPAMSKVQALKHKYEQAKRTADAGREKPTAIQAGKLRTPLTIGTGSLWRPPPNSKFACRRLTV